ncbi:MAG: phosphoribosylamine--glycine ligase [Candidatus Sungbacteria bacterium RIFCSPLOWO2_01_FULL_60_25]|uniref:phosphoribosylamine--glycine ligase n=1 Tax=Candidatus Sungbacteria bacterium RIFCSPLOWO2_01_FULL_60_25 TaxID=1802281 RepID=A0A1G2LFV4_9BACT|nr:MAG: phosphoribosylamine--glycine ligase [Candidatus Sungbacteria bacterium RIFCSPLOWO2_01_FULL_60_25]
MRVMVIGSGGREDALSRALAESKIVTGVIVAPGRKRLKPLKKIANVPIPASDTNGLIELAQENRIELIVPGPETQLVAGFADMARRAGFNVFGPSAGVAMLTEGSKCAAKRFMERSGIPTAAPFRCFSPGDNPKIYVKFLTTVKKAHKIVVKDDQLAGGKGVTIAPTPEDALAAAEKLASRGHGYVIERCLEGREMTYTCLVAGASFLPLASSRDYKVFNGKMSGGMAAISPEPRLTPELEAKILERIVRPTIKGLIAEGYCYCGFLYFGIIVVNDEPLLLEYNCRLGDPEAQVILPRLLDNLAPVLLAGATLGKFPPTLRWDPRAAATVVLAAEGYPESPVPGAEIFGIEEAEAEPDTIVYRAGSDERDGKIFVSGGRVLNVTGFGATPRRALDRAFASAAKIKFAGMQRISADWDVGPRD